MGLERFSDDVVIVVGVKPVVSDGEFACEYAGVKDVGSHAAYAAFASVYNCRPDTEFDGLKLRLFTFRRDGGIRVDLLCVFNRFLV